MQEPVGGETGSSRARPVGTCLAGLPVLGEVPAALWWAVREGQPVVLTREGRPAVVVVDLDSWAEVEALLGEE
jgi:hypothetical protein